MREREGERERESFHHWRALKLGFKLVDASPLSISLSC